MVAITAVLGEYKNFVEGEDRQYELNVVYQAMSYFDLINNFQFSIPIYILIFMLVSMLILFCIIIIWFVNIKCSRVKNPPVIKFRHMAKVTFLPPTFGSVAASIPVLFASIGIKLLSQTSLFENTAAQWSALGSELTSN